MGLDAPFGKVKDWPCLQLAFHHPEGSLHTPKFVVPLYHGTCLEVCVGHVTFEPVPTRVVSDSLFINADMNVIFDNQKFVVAALVDVLFADLSGSVCLAQPGNAFLPVVGVFLGARGRIAYDDALIAVDCSLVQLVGVFGL